MNPEHTPDPVPLPDRWNAACLRIEDAATRLTGGHPHTVSPAEVEALTVVAEALEAAAVTVAMIGQLAALRRGRGHG